MQFEERTCSSMSDFEDAKCASWASLFFSISLESWRCGASSQPWHPRNGCSQFNFHSLLSRFPPICHRFDIKKNHQRIENHILARITLFRVELLSLLQCWLCVFPWCHMLHYFSSSMHLEGIWFSPSLSFKHLSNELMHEGSFPFLKHLLQ